jgi:hypothetical protein
VKLAWHREQIVKNRTLLEELEAANTAEGDVFPETRSEIEHLKAQIAQSELIVAASEKTQVEFQAPVPAHHGIDRCRPRNG